MVEENISQEFRLKNMKNDLMSQKQKEVCTSLNHIEHFLILVSAITGYISISPFASLLLIPKKIMSSATGLKICAIVAGIKKYKSIIKKKKMKHDKIVFLTKSELNSIKS